MPEVMDLAATGGLVKGVRIEGVTGGATPAKVFDLTLAEVTVTKVVDGENDGYSLSLDYGKIALVTDGIDATGQRNDERRVRLRRQPTTSKSIRSRLP